MDILNKLNSTLTNAINTMEEMETMFECQREQYSKLQDAIYEFCCEEELEEKFYNFLHSKAKTDWYDGVKSELERISLDYK